MNIEELDRDEQLALGGLLRLLVRSDGDFTEAEESQIDAIGERMGGPAAIWKLISDSAQAYPHDGAIRAAALGVKRPAARELIVALLREVAAPDGVHARETALLEWLTGEWRSG